MRALIRSVGELCITAGVVLLLFVGYELWGTGTYTRHQQDVLSTTLTRSWKTHTHAVVTHEHVQFGEGIALIRIPSLGAGYRYVIVEGVSIADLRKGPGHYPGTAMPGDVGNFVVSGHRTTYLAPFNRVGELRDGDKILIDTSTAQYVYQVTGKKVVDPSDVEVAAPVPEHPDEQPAKRLITLTTCNPKYSAAQRLIIFGELVTSVPRAEGA